MKKTAILLIILLLLSLGGVCVAGASVYDTSDEVRLTETVIYGDPRAADGLQFELNTELDNQLQWNSRISFPNDGETKTAFSFYPKRIPRTPSFSSNLQIHVASGYQNFEPDTEQTGLHEAMQELWEKAAPGEEVSGEFLLRDYLAYYPLELMLNLPDGTAYFQRFDSHMLHSEEANNSETKFQRSMEDYFRIPVLETETIRLNVYRNEQNRPASYGSSSTDSDSYSMSFWSVRAGNTIYFVISGTSKDGEVMDFSQLPEGYGIFALPLEAVGTDDAGQPLYEPQADQLDMVYQLEPGTTISNLRCSPDERHLILETIEDGVLCMTVLDVETMSVIQPLELVPCGYLAEVKDYGDYMVYRVGGEPSQILVLTRGNDGICKLALAVQEKPEHTDGFYLHPYHCIYAYDGTRLAVINPMPTVEKPGYRMSEHDNLNCGFFLAIYEQDGLSYFGIYDNSLQTTSNHDYQSIFRGCYHSESPVQPQLIPKT